MTNTNNLTNLVAGHDDEQSEQRGGDHEDADPVRHLAACVRTENKIES